MYSRLGITRFDAPKRYLIMDLSVGRDRDICNIIPSRGDLTDYVCVNYHKLFLFCNFKNYGRI